ncbi:tRNA(fMet)-specific endonuclease VapC [bacterium HR16]|nr:tRNA(fMet)-specific endonuclease VapC [bacterium HR16]
MGTLNIPDRARVYIDANVFIYTVERHSVYYPLLKPLWQASQEGRIEVCSSELIVLEAMVLPFRTADALLIADYEKALASSDLILLPMTREILLDAAKLRASITGLHTPDAIHAATAMGAQCSLLLTNDRIFQRVLGLNAVVIGDLA